jgi:hypothetical protein
LVSGNWPTTAAAGYPVWSLVYIAIAVMVIYGLLARYSEQAA